MLREISVDYLGNNRYVFDIKGNDFRMVVIIIFISKKVYVRLIGNHDQYDKIDATKVLTMNAKEYRTENIRMEELLTVLTDKGKLTKRQHQELDQVSEQIAQYEEEHYPFKPETLIEMIELRMYQRK